MDPAHFELGSEELKSVCIADLAAKGKSCSLLVIPQACIGGKPKGKVFQYYSLVEKNQGQELYEEFIRKIRVELNKMGGAQPAVLEEEEEEEAKNKIKTKAGVRLAFGVYGNRQGLKLASSGPYTHTCDI